MWGRKTWETEKILREELGDNRVQVASIGPAGEKRGRVHRLHQPGKSCRRLRGRLGDGVKKLKAIAVRGHGSVEVAEPQRFMAAVNRALAKIKASPYSQGWRKGIIEAKFLPQSPAWNLLLLFATGRMNSGRWKRVKLVGLERGVPRYKKRMMACFACPIGCLPFSEIQEGQYKGTKGVGYWINSATYSSRLDLDDPAASLRYHLMLNQLGLDGDMCTVSLAWAFECFEKGLLGREDCDGLELRWGAGEAILEMQKKLAYREGIGDFLADGVKDSARKLGKGSDYFATHIKGQDSVDPYRAAKGWGLGVAISPVGGRHLRGAVSAPEVTGPKGLKWNPLDTKTSRKRFSGNPRPKRSKIWPGYAFRGYLEWRPCLGIVGLCRADFLGHGH